MTEQELEIVRRYNHDKDLTHQSEMNSLIEKEEINLVALLKPKIYPDGNQWCVLYGEDIQTGIVGFGDTPRKAIFSFNKAFDEPIKYCMPDNVNTKEEHEQYLIDIGSIKVYSNRLLKDDKWQVIDQHENIYFQGSEIECLQWIDLKSK